MERNGAAPSLRQETDSTDAACHIVETVPEPVPEPAEAPVVSETPAPAVQQEEVKKTKEEKGSRFGKLFKKKAPTQEKEEKSGGDQAAAAPPPPPADPQTVSIDFLMS